MATVSWPYDRAAGAPSAGDLRQGSLVFHHGMKQPFEVFHTRPRSRKISHLSTLSGPD